MALFVGDYILPPPVAAFLAEHKGGGFVAAMGMNMCAGKLIATSAFEIFVNGVPVHSKVGGLRARRRAARTRVSACVLFASASSPPARAHA